MPHEVREGEFFASDDRALIDLGVVHAFLSTCYWSKGIPRALVEKAAAHSLCFGVYRDRKCLPGVPTCEQVGFARVVTDRATFAYLADVFVLDQWRGRGLSKLLMRCVMTHPELLGLRRWLLMTRDAHGLYRHFGWEVTGTPERVMEIIVKDAYRRGEPGGEPAR
ncbi:MAG: GNAT family N-acetyltransferase [Planctomycetes bacterium]|nr:GNAT family N-acetyltransferase [Planctomycetota bacterium]